MHIAGGISRLDKGLKGVPSQVKLSIQKLYTLFVCFDGYLQTMLLVKFAGDRFENFSDGDIFKW